MFLTIWVQCTRLQLIPLTLHPELWLGHLHIPPPLQLRTVYISYFTHIFYIPAKIFSFVQPTISHEFHNICLISIPTDAHT